MNLKEMMQYSNFVVVGDTLNEEKYAYKIKHLLLDSGYNVQCVGKEHSSINDVETNIDILVLCIHPAKGIEILKQNNKAIKGVIIQPGAISAEIVDFLCKNNYTYIEGCALVGVKQFCNK